MKKTIPIKKFSFRVLLFSVIMAGLTVIFQWLCPKLASPALPFIVLFFFIITLFTLYIVLREDYGNEGKKFVSAYILSRVIKVVSCLIFLIVYILLNKADAWRFGIAFMVIYFIYSIYEVIVLKKENQDLHKIQQAAKDNSTEKTNVNKDK